jgi:hypothetical protein
MKFGKILRNCHVIVKNTQKITLSLFCGFVSILYWHMIFHEELLSGHSSIAVSFVRNFVRL